MINQSFLRYIEFNIVKKIIFITSLVYIYFIYYQYIVKDDFLVYFLIIYSFFSFALILSFKYIKSIILKFITLKLYIGYIIFLPFLHNDKLYYEDASLRSVGNFSFNMIEYIDMYSVVFYYFIIFILLSIILQKIVFSNVYIKLKNIIINQNKNSLIKQSITTTLSIGFVLVILQYYLNIIMFDNKIGIAGISPNNIGYKLAGLLYHYKKLFYPLIILYITFKNLNNRYIGLFLVLVFFEFITGSIYSLSKGIVILHSLPFLFYFGVKRKFLMFIVSLLIVIFFIAFVPIGRNWLYNVNLINFSSISLFDIIQFNFKTIYELRDSGILDTVYDGVKLFLMRMVALKEFAMVYFNDYRPEDINIFLNTFLKLPFTSSPNFQEYGFFGFDTSFIEQRKAMGYTFAYSLGIFSKLYLSNSIFAIPLLSLYILIALFFERFIIRIINLIKLSNLMKILIFYTLALMFIQFYYLIHNIIYIIFIIEVVLMILISMQYYSKRIA